MRPPFDEEREGYFRVRRHPRGGFRPYFPRHERVAWWRLRKGLQRRLFLAFGLAIGLSIGAASLVHRVFHEGPGRDHATPLLAFGFTFLILWFFSSMLSAGIAYPFVRLATLVREFGDGNLDLRANVPPRAPAEVRELGYAFDAMAERIAGQIRGQRELLAAVSHELRTPLARLRLVLELAHERGADDRLVGEAVAEIEAMDALVGSLLAGARLDAGAVQRLDVDLVALARDAVVRASERTSARGYALEADADRLLVKGDPALLARALTILLDNAERHGGPNVIVRVRAGGFLEVEDDGVGIPVAERARVFEPFVRGEGKAYDEARGVGLGLHLLRRIAEAHEAKAYVESEGVGVRIGIGPIGRGVGVGR